MRNKSVKDAIAEVCHAVGRGRKMEKKIEKNMEEFEKLIENPPPPDPETEDTLRLEEEKDKTRKIWADETKKHILYLTDVKNPGLTFQAPISDTVVIGRRAGESDIVIDYEKSVSARHCQISERNGKFYVKDLQSANGSFLNGIRLSEEMEIYSGSFLTLGRLKIKVQIR